VGFVPSFQVEDGIRELIEIYRRRGVRIVNEVLEVPHGWIAFISDLEGNVLQIYQAKGARE
jgi:predicted enzyme related to lactoylglutathione lyase